MPADRGDNVNNLLNQKLISAEIVDISWERVNLYIDIKINYGNGFDSTTPLLFYAIDESDSAKAKFEAERLSEKAYRLHLNITNPGSNRCMPTGNYSILVLQGENILAPCLISQEIISKISDFSKSFLYENNANVYKVDFHSDDTDTLSQRFVMSITDSGAQVKLPFKRRAKRGVIKAVYKLLLMIHSKSKNTVLFMSEQNKKIGGNLKAVSDRMIERKLDEKYTLLYSFRSSVDESQSLASWFSLLNKLAKSTTLVMDDHAPFMDLLVIDKKTTVIQLWHAGAGFKSSGYSRWGKKGCPSPYSCHRQYTYGTAGSANIAHFFSEAWGINTEQVIPIGMPRMDLYLSADYMAKKETELLEKYPICKNKKVILFAPTYRGKNKADAHYPYGLIDFKGLYDVCGDEYVVLFKMHPWAKAPVPIPQEYSDKFIDAGSYSNINDLFYLTALLITDYSSNIFEYSLMRKPALFFAFDEKQYSSSRGFHRDYKLSAPGKVVKSFDELLAAIKNKDFEQEKIDEYIDYHFDYIDCKSSDRVIDWLILGNLPESFKKAIDEKFSEVKHTLSLDFSLN